MTRGASRTTPASHQSEPLILYLYPFSYPVGEVPCVGKCSSRGAHGKGIRTSLLAPNQAGRPAGGWG
eukprot:5066561-Heterocapsa_arctica.AAC.1